MCNQFHTYAQKRIYSQVQQYNSMFNTIKRSNNNNWQFKQGQIQSFVETSIYGLYGLQAPIKKHKAQNSIQAQSVNCDCHEQN